MTWHDMTSGELQFSLRLLLRHVRGTNVWTLSAMQQVACFLWRSGNLSLNGSHLPSFTWFKYRIYNSVNYVICWHSSWMLVLVQRPMWMDLLMTNQIDLGTMLSCMTSLYGKALLPSVLAMCATAYFLGSNLLCFGDHEFFSLQQLASINCWTYFFQ